MRTLTQHRNYIAVVSSSICTVAAGVQTTTATSAPTLRLAASAQTWGRLHLHLPPTMLAKNGLAGSSVPEL